MIYELRIYTCKPGACEAVLAKWKNEGRSMLDLYFRMVGQWTSSSGELNQIYTLWEFDDFDHRQRARKQLLLHPGFAEYLAECRALYVAQESTFLEATSLSPIGGRE